MTRYDLLETFYVKKDYANLKILLKNSDDIYSLNLLAKIYLEEKDFELAALIYRKINAKYELGRCMLLQGRADLAKELWSDIEYDNPQKLWGRSLIQFIDQYVTVLPTFFQIRSFLEVDLDALLSAKQYEYCENIINGADLMARNNTECYKFIGRVFVNNSLFDMAKIYLEKAKDVCYVDPEVHFLLAKCYIANNNLVRAKNSLETCIEKACGYFPAKKLLKELNLS